jgi:hypothetical protein
MNERRGFLELGIRVVVRRSLSSEKSINTNRHAVKGHREWASEKIEEGGCMWEYIGEETNATAGVCRQWNSLPLNILYKSMPIFREKGNYIL